MFNVSKITATNNNARSKLYQIFVHSCIRITSLYLWPWTPGIINTRIDLYNISVYFEKTRTLLLGDFHVFEPSLLGKKIFRFLQELFEPGS